MSFSIARSSRNPSKFGIVRSDNMESKAEFTFADASKKFSNASRTKNWVARTITKSTFIKHDVAQTIADQQFNAYFNH